MDGAGESAEIISDSLEASGFEMADEVLKVNWNPDNESVAKCIEYGKRLSEKFVFDLKENYLYKIINDEKIKI